MKWNLELNIEKTNLSMDEIGTIVDELILKNFKIHQMNTRPSKGYDEIPNPVDHYIEKIHK